MAFSQRLVAFFQRLLTYLDMNWPALGVTTIGVCSAWAPQSPVGEFVPLLKQSKDMAGAFAAFSPLLAGLLADSSWSLCRKRGGQKRCRSLAIAWALVGVAGALLNQLIVTSRYVSEVPPFPVVALQALLYTGIVMSEATAARMARQLEKWRNKSERVRL